MPRTNFMSKYEHNKQKKVAWIMLKLFTELTSMQHFILKGSNWRQHKQNILLQHGWNFKTSHQNGNKHKWLQQPVLWPSLQTQNNPATLFKLLNHFWNIMLTINCYNLAKHWKYCNSMAAIVQLPVPCSKNRVAGILLNIKNTCVTLQ